jgi:hypothetical protein
MPETGWQRWRIPGRSNSANGIVPHTWLQSTPHGPVILLFCSSFYLISHQTHKKMGAIRTHPIKNERTAPICSPSFVYRQDGYELSYSFYVIISAADLFVNKLILHNFPFYATIISA